MNQYRHPLTDQVAQAMAGREVTIGELLSEFPGVTYVQMRNCLLGLFDRGLAERASSRGGGKKATYRGLAVPTVRVRVSCVWQLGTGMIANLPTGMVGKQYQPLGEW